MGLAKCFTIFYFEIFENSTIFSISLLLFIAIKRRNFSDNFDFKGKIAATLLIRSHLWSYLRSAVIELQNKVHRGICVRDIAFFIIKIHNIAMEGILCDDVMSERSKMWKSLKYLAI